MKNLRDLLEHEVKDLYSAESQLIEALPKMVKAAHDKSLKKAFEDHLSETKNQRDRIKKVADMLDMDPKGHACKAMKGLVKECEGMIDEKADADVKDAGLIGCAQRVEHYEIAGYGTAHKFAQMLDLDDVADLLAKTLEEEKDANEKLNDLAIEKINKKAKS